MRIVGGWVCGPVALYVALSLAACGGSDDADDGPVATAGSKLPPLGVNKQITEADCTSARLGTSIPTTSIGEPVSSVSVATPIWVAAAGALPAYCSVTGAMSPVDPTAPLINFRVVLPTSWAYRAGQQGGGGMNGSIPNLTNASLDGGTPYVARGWAVSASDSGHVNTDGGAWSLNEEAVKNFGYMQMKKTHDAAWVLIERMYGEKPRFSYWTGTSQGGREGLTVAQRYPADYDGVVVNVPVVNFSSLTLGPTLIRIQERPLAAWVTQAKRTSIATEVMRQCDQLDGLNDGIINNYMGCRAVFDITRGTAGRTPWANIRCPGNVDPDPANTTASACLTDGQIATMQFVHTRYRFSTRLANDNPSFGMWLPGTDPGSESLIVPARVQGQEGASASSPIFTSTGMVAVTGSLFKNLGANPLDYVEGGSLNARRVELSGYSDATNPDLGPFYKRGGKLIVMMGTNDNRASSASILDYYESVLDELGRTRTDSFARLWVVPGTGHGLNGTQFAVDGSGQATTGEAIPSTIDRIKLLTDWVESNTAPPLNAQVTGVTRSLPLCSYPTFPKYQSGPTSSASSYACASP